MIDIAARQKLLDRQREKMLFQSITDSFQKSIDKIPQPNIELNNEDVIKNTNKLGILLVMIANSLKKFKLPSVFSVKGDVKVTNPIEINNFDDLAAYFVNLETQLKKFNEAISSLPAPQVHVPEIKIPEIKIPKIEVPKPDPVQLPEIKVPPPTVFVDFKKESQAIIAAIKDLKKFFDIRPVKEKTNEKSDILASDIIKSLTEAITNFNNKDFPRTVEIGNFPRQMIPQPVTHISVNSLKGSFLATSVSVGSTATLLPATNLSNRRAVTVFNNDTTAVLYLGSSTVTTLNGLPVLAQNYSPIFDAGVNMNLYGICSGTIDVRVLELSDEASGR